MAKIKLKADFLMAEMDVFSIGAKRVGAGDWSLSRPDASAGCDSARRA
ncbi:MAG: hypothetical protein ACI83P_002246 [Janthinobacterium sp.]|jgi:hypothetical protein